MLLSWNWLSDFVDLDGLSVEEVADRLTLAGLEVEGIDELGGDWDHVVTARVAAVEPHPDADSLQICSVDVGNDEPLTIVCGAANVHADAVVACAQIGAVLPGDFKIKKSKIRGVKSFGMLCGADELGLQNGVDGLMLLPSDVSPGVPFAEWAGLSDTVIELSITPNRSDCFSVRGVAREVAALFGRELRENADVERVANLPRRGGAVGERVKVQIPEGGACRRYAAAILDEVEVGPSPLWMQSRLIAAGQRPINNLVDVTNFINLGYGQPMHAFDFDRVEGHKITVRYAEKGENIETLDNVERELVGGELLIADDTKPLAIAGVMGGASTQIESGPVTVLLECANFTPSVVRPTARRLKLHTDSSHRFERGVDPRMVPETVELAIGLIAATQSNTSSATRADGFVDAVHGEFNDVQIELPVSMPQDILGGSYPPDDCEAALTAIGLGVERNDGVFSVTVPPRRPDLTRPIDLVEEVGRVVGFDRMPPEFPLGRIGFVHERRDDAPVQQQQQPVRSNAEVDLVDRIKQVCAESGAWEAVNWALASAALQEQVTGVVPPLRPNNALSSDADSMRFALLPGLLKSVQHNRARQQRRVALFELAACFVDADLSSEDRERRHLSAVLAGPRHEAWYADETEFDLHDVVGLLTRISRVSGREMVFRISADPAPWMHPGASVDIIVDGERVGQAAELHPSVASSLELKGRVAAFELDLDSLIAAEPVSRMFSELPTTFGSTRDVALLVPDALSFAELGQALERWDDQFFEGYHLFDVYTGKELPEGQRSLAIQMSYRHPKPGKSLKDKHVDQAHGRLLQHLEEAHGLKPR